jgi:hypothetical protein
MRALSRPIWPAVIAGPGTPHHGRARLSRVARRDRDRENPTASAGWTESASIAALTKQMSQLRPPKRTEPNPNKSSGPSSLFFGAPCQFSSELIFSFLCNLSVVLSLAREYQFWRSADLSHRELEEDADTSRGKKRARCERPTKSPLAFQWSAIRTFAEPWTRWIPF